ncbi:MAG: hypothetical protein CVU88_08080 [Firmicutes bacterium HGW-Firmicutes-13]|jgi:hemerythrin|nr:MAG: hypothetical protein CVV44_08525 [Spirochaetae bacterium HGW-Spirochaetae-1]PKM78998.1 MAG: hypothetical protein CVU88_08080 [Firmicutes bacterium HGW-Firmicutes-13]
MQNFKWTDNYDTKITIIDIQHKQLFKKIDILTIAIYEGKSKKFLKELLLFLEEYIEKHFTFEENIMKLNNYPDYDKHILQHEQFRSLFNDFADDFKLKGGDSYLAIRLEKEIRKWWEYHILNIDMMYVPYIIK